MKKDEQIVGPPVKHAVELAAVMAPQLPQGTIDLRRMGKRKRRSVSQQTVEAIDLHVERSLSCGIAKPL